MLVLFTTIPANVYFITYSAVIYPSQDLSVGFSRSVPMVNSRSDWLLQVLSVEQLACTPWRFLSADNWRGTKPRVNYQNR